ncbi:MAG TPA: tRNA (adenosine(37)-N6)-threonylcarbamoyltransferase complex ATPase subunit type 1 TsaE [Candidatus Dormibacteraeota bacterium]|nr:tRNA (adenosine(37)-N6)-threonylcarbamoyltransferase complex ATPase subunit type 1 TsaE [Candidatus Dormibacteraeota bacterium]
MVTTTLRELVTASPAETEAAGEALGSRLSVGDVVLLVGELGAGKTTFVRGVARGAGSTAPVASPTFQLVRVYPGRLQLAHIDLYRIEKAPELAELGLDELADQGAVLIEWGDRLLSLTSPLPRYAGQYPAQPGDGEEQPLTSPLVGKYRPQAGDGEEHLPFAIIEIEHLGGDRRVLRTRRDLGH